MTVSRMTPTEAAGCLLYLAIIEIGFIALGMAAFLFAQIALDAITHLPL